jgi:hypothetical protein
MRQLIDRRPLTLRIGTFVLHRVEVLLLVKQPQALDALSRQLLSLLDNENHPQHLEGLESLLGLGQTVIARLARALQEIGLLITSSHQHSSAPAWSVTPAGRQALKENQVFRQSHERRVLTFVNGEPASGSAEYVKVTSSEWGTSFAPGKGEAHFTPSVLRACIKQNSEWKRRRDFPRDIVDLCDSPGCRSAGQHIVIDRPERCHVLLLQDAEGVHGFSLRLPEWSLQSAKPSFTLTPDDFALCFPRAAVLPSMEEWRLAWREWGQARKQTTDVLDANTLEPEGMHLRIQAPSHVIDQLAPFLAKDEGWIIAGGGAWRSCARIEFQTISSA